MVMLPSYRKIRAFTLTEMMIVIIIVGVLAILAVNQFYGPREQALEREATANLKLIAAAEKIYRLEVGGYISAADTDTVNKQLSLMLPELNPKWAYKIANVSGTGDTFTGYAGRTNGTGAAPSAGASSICINQSGEDPYKPCTW
jgi:prepilin-type N-terminal cleavage/methylation domain-containing protein